MGKRQLRYRIRRMTADELRQEVMALHQATVDLRKEKASVRREMSLAKFNEKRFRARAANLEHMLQAYTSARG